MNKIDPRILRQAKFVETDPKIATAKCRAEVDAALGKYGCELLPVLTFSGGQYVHGIKLVKKNLESVKSPGDNKENEKG